MRSADVEDLTAKAQIRETAMELFARYGIARTSLRAVARAAGVSPALVVHHFASKQGLCEAVDEAVVRRFTAVLLEVPLEIPAGEQLEQRSVLIGRIVQDEPIVCDYLARALAEGGDAGTDLFGRLLAAARADAPLVRAGVMRADSDPLWRALQQVVLIVGPLMLRPLVERELGVSLYAKDSVERWMRANVDLMQRGLYTSHDRRG